MRVRVFVLMLVLMPLGVVSVSAQTSGVREG